MIYYKSRQLQFGNKIVYEHMLSFIVSSVAVGKQE